MYYFLTVISEIDFMLAIVDNCLWIYFDVKLSVWMNTGHNVLVTPHWHQHINCCKVTKLLYVFFQKEVEIFFENICILKHLYYNLAIIVKYINYINFGSIV